MEPKDCARLLAEVIPIARRAGDSILEIYGTDFEVRTKGDLSPVTAADERAEAIILDGLARIAPGIPIVSEESTPAGAIATTSALFWLVDPLDGTREFVGRNGEFTVNIALVREREPVMGVVLAPALDCLYGGAAGHGAFMQDAAGHRAISCAGERRKDGLVVVSSRSHGDAQALGTFLRGREILASVKIGSSLKFCLLARGEADLYPRLGATMEWDTAAGHAVLVAAGGRVTELNGDRLRYGKPGYLNPPFIATSEPC